MVYDTCVLKRILADNFHALVNFELRPERLSLLLGENGSGKTSVLNVLEGLRDLIVVGRSTTELFANTRTKWETRDVQRFELDMEGAGGIYPFGRPTCPGHALCHRPRPCSQRVLALL